MTKKKDNHKNRLLMAVCFACAVVFCIAVMLLVLFYSGKTTTTGKNTSATTTNHVSCSGDATSYPFFSYDNSNKKKIKIDAIFDDDSLRSIALTYKLYYTTSEEITISESANHAAMNIAFGEENLSADALDATYSKQNDGLQFSIYADENDLTDSALEFFMLDPVNENSYNDESMTSHYNHLGMDCEIIK